MKKHSLKHFFGLGLLLTSASVGLWPSPAAATTHLAQAEWHNCLTREVFTPEKQAWCDRWETLQSGTYIVAVGHQETPEYTTVTLVDGEYQSADGSLYVTLANEPGWLAFGSLDGNDRTDAVVILGVATGGTAVSTSMAAVLDIDGAAQALSPVVLGDRIRLNGPMTIDNLRINLPQLTQTEVINRAFVADGGTLSELAQLPTPERVPGGIPDGTLIFSNTPTYAVRVFIRENQPYLNLFNRITGRQELSGVRVVATSSVNDVVYSYGGSSIEGRPAVRLSVSNRGEQTLEVNDQMQTELTAVTGAVTYRPRIALPTNAVIEVSLVDVSRADAPAITLASQGIVTGGRQVPIPFELVYNPDSIDARYTYAVQARIMVDGELRFINTSRFAVLTQGQPSQIEVVVEPISR